MGTRSSIVNAKFISGRTMILAAAAVIAAAGSAHAAQIGPVFVIAMENHNWTQPSSYTSTQAIFGNTAAPYINSLVTPGNANAQYSSYASKYVNDISEVTGNESHPSEPNYVWSEAGKDFGITNDNNPYGSGGTARPVGTPSLTGLMQAGGRSWKSYQEGTDLTTNGSGQLTNTVVSPGNYTVPLASFSGTSTAYTNQYNGSHQYNYAAKHNPQVYFPSTSGGNNATNTNPQASHFAPHEQLATDLANGTFGQYNWITPDQYNDMHTSLTGGFTYNGHAYTGDSANIAQGDNYLAQVIPMIEASAAFQSQGGTIIIWNDECEGDTVATRGQFSSMEIVISKLAKGNAYNSTIQYTHSSDLKTMQELTGAADYTTATGFLGDAANATDLADMFLPGALPNAGASSIPEPSTTSLIGLATLALAIRRRRA